MGDALMWQTKRARLIRSRREVGAAIRFARQGRGWRLADLAVRTGYSVSTLSRLETSRRRPTDLEQVRRIAGAVGIPIDPRRVARRVVRGRGYGGLYGGIAG